MHPHIAFSYYPLTTLDKSWVKEIQQGEQLMSYGNSLSHTICWEANKAFLSQYTDLSYLQILDDNPAHALAMSQQNEWHHQLLLLGCLVCWQDIKKIINGKLLAAIKSEVGPELYDQIMAMAPLISRHKRAFVEANMPKHLNAPVSQCTESSVCQWLIARGIAVFSCALGNDHNGFKLRIAWKSHHDLLPVIEHSWQAASDELDHKWSCALLKKIAKRSESKRNVGHAA